MNFSGKNILVVGGSSGIGLSLVDSLSSKGATVYVVSRSKNPNWSEGVKHLAFDVLEALDQLSDFLPDQLHGLAYTVGSITLKPFNRLQTEDFIRDYQLNVLGAFRIIQIAQKALKAAQGSSIVLISSVAAQLGMPYHASVAAAKGGLESMALSLAAEFAGQQIRVNVIAPSLTDTPMAEKLLNSPEKQEGAAKRHPIGRFGSPSDSSELITFLLNDQSSWITGQVIGVDGGIGKLKTN